MQIKEEKHDDVTVITLKGKMMGGPETLAVHEKVKELAENKDSKVVIDLSKVKWMNSSGLGILIGCMTTLKNAGGELKLAAVTEKVQSLFMITKLVTIFDTEDDVEIAIKNFQ
ncbi:MAG: anti-sigma factor antagonist [Caldithrix sp.]|nr:MAG: anti-sigma factor antagonist [Caldithrix sp.]TDJ03132.1 MAG: anti-sigma factor antagonist [Caldithrix sp.]